MTILKSEILLAQPAEKVYQFLNNLNHHQQLMPDAISHWESTEETCSFTAQNMIKLKLKISNRIENQKIEAIPDGESPVPLTLIWEIESLNPESCKAIYSIHAELNMMLKMVAKPMLQQLVDHEVQKLAELMSV